MKCNLFSLNHLSILGAYLCASALLAGCSKHKDESASQAASTPAATNTAASDPANPSAGDPAAQAPPGPVLDASQMTGDPKVALAEADAAVRQKEYEKAAKLMVAIQQAQMNQQQAAVAYQQMVAFQRALAGAAASGTAIARGVVLLDW